jgi:hypothetical protein
LIEGFSYVFFTSFAIKLLLIIIFVAIYPEKTASDEEEEEEEDHKDESCSSDDDESDDDDELSELSDEEEGGDDSQRVDHRPPNPSFIAPSDKPFACVVSRVCRVSCAAKQVPVTIQLVTGTTVTVHVDPKRTTGRRLMKLALGILSSLLLLGPASSFNCNSNCVSCRVVCRVACVSCVRVVNCNSATAGRVFEV